MNLSILMHYSTSIIILLSLFIIGLVLIFHIIKKQKWLFEIQLLKNQFENEYKLLHNEIEELTQTKTELEQSNNNKETITSHLNQQLSDLNIKLAEKNTENQIIPSLLAEKESLQYNTTQLQESLAETKIQLEKCILNQQKDEQAYKEQMALLQSNKEQLKQEFENLANTIFESKTQKFTEQNQSNIHKLVEPISSKFKDFTQLIHDTYEKETQERSSLKQELQNLKELNKQLNSEAHALTNALAGKNYKTQGNWGEMILEKILENSGLRKNQDYFLQKQYLRKEDEGASRLQPDATIQLPENKHIIVDSKVSLNDYTRYINTEDPEEKKKHLKGLTEAVKNHIKRLSDKEYYNLPDANSLDFVLMFIPIEPAFLTVLQTDDELLQYAFERQIMLVGPSTLLAMLKTIANIWRFENQTENALKIAQEGGKLYDKFVNFLNKFDDVGKSIERAHNSFEDAKKNLSTGRGNLINKIENLKKMGAQTNKSVGANYLTHESLPEPNNQQNRTTTDPESSVADE